MNDIFTEEPTVVVQRTAIEEELDTDPTQTHILDLSDIEYIISDLVVYGNPLLNPATDILGMLITIPRQGKPTNVELFRQQLLNKIADFRKQAVHLSYHPSVLDKSCFVLCAALDEAIIYTPWGEQHHWQNNSLLSKVFQERNGGEVFFQLLEKACHQPTKLIDFIELQYVLLMLGFQGLYRDQKESELYDLKTELYAILKIYRDKQSLTRPQASKPKKASPPRHFLNMKTVLAFSVFIVLMSYGISEYWYFNRSKHISNELEQIGLINIHPLTNVELFHPETEPITPSTPHAPKK
ncbi:type IVB secretion system protein IcmH/DotU [Parashewanella tropica]|uniref:type IVB secretion system protein IcmH/DotU n=1 Tax=Parashewanella tropica TaxID=2547970 RepID=UPI001059C3B3|nr:type IVB secretion system protein IcmH/DotU [Parashewanella tropica]